MKVFCLLYYPDNPSSSRAVEVQASPKFQRVEDAGVVRPVGFNHTGEASLADARKACIKLLTDREMQQGFRDSLSLLLALPLGPTWMFITLSSLIATIGIVLGSRGFWGYQLFQLPLTYLHGIGLVIGSIISVLGLILMPDLRRYLFNKSWWRDLLSYHNERDNREKFFEEACWEIELKGLPNDQLVDGPSAGLALFFAILQTIVKFRPECKALFWYRELEKYVDTVHGGQFAAVGRVNADAEVMEVGEIEGKLCFLLNENRRISVQNQSRLRPQEVAEPHEATMSMATCLDNEINLLLGAEDNRRAWQAGWKNCKAGEDLPSTLWRTNIYRAEDHQAERKITFYFFAHLKDFLRQLMPPFHWKWRVFRLLVCLAIGAILLGAIPGPPAPTINIGILDIPYFRNGDARIGKIKSGAQTRIEIQSGVKVTWQNPQLFGCLNVEVWSFDETLSFRKDQKTEMAFQTKLCPGQDVVYWFTLPPDKDQVQVFIVTTNLAKTKLDRKIIVFERE